MDTAPRLPGIRVVLCRGIVESSRGRGAIELGRERGFGDVGCSGDGVTKSLPSFGSRNGGETLHAAIIHYKATSPSYSGSYVCVRLDSLACPKASQGAAYKGVQTLGLQEKT